MKCVCDLQKWLSENEPLPTPCEKFEQLESDKLVCARCEHWEQCHKEEE